MSKCALKLILYKGLIYDVSLEFLKIAKYIAVNVIGLMTSW